MFSDPAAELADKFHLYAVFRALCEQFREPTIVAVELVQANVRDEREARMLLAQRWLERPPASDERMH